MVAVFGVSSALVLPPFQAPDETEHFAYAQTLATRVCATGRHTPSLGISTDQALADRAVGASSLAWASGSANLFDRLYSMRLWGVALLLANVLASGLAPVHGPPAPGEQVRC